MPEQNNKSRPSTTMMVLRYDYTPDEEAQMGHDIANNLRTLGQLNDAKKSAVATFVAKIKEVEEAIGALRDRLNAGHDMRQVKCTVLYDVPEVGKKTISRGDTGELVSVEEMSEWERQPDLPFSEGDESHEESAEEGEPEDGEAEPEPEPETEEEAESSEEDDAPPWS